jgi:hypothetical protein
MRRATLLIFLVVATAATFTSVRAKTPEEVAEAWFSQLYRFDALEAYEIPLVWGSVEFVVARRWKGELAQIVIDVRSPRELGKWAFLFLQNRGRSDDFFAYVPLPQVMRVRRFTAAQLEAGIPIGGQMILLSDIRPPLPGELIHTSLPDTEVAGESCWAVESRPSGRRLGFDRMVLQISQETGVALRTQLYRGRREVRRITVSPADVRRFDDRYLPVRRQVRTSSNGNRVEVFLRNLMIDPPLPDQLFSKQILITQRFPSF